MILDGHYPSDIRVRKEAESLSLQHNVSILCCRKEGEKAYEKIHNVSVFREVVYKSNYHKAIIDIQLSINFRHPFFRKELSKLNKKISIDVIHVHDLPLAKTVYSFAKKNKIKTILDLHENYPAALLTWFAWRKSFVIKFKNKLFFGYKRWSNYEQRIIKKYDFIIAVVEEMKDRILKESNIDSDKVFVVTNTEKKEFVSNFKYSKQNYFQGNQDKCIISYVGGFGPHRGLHTAIEGMYLLKNKMPNALLVLIGPMNKDVRSHLEELIHRFSLKGYVLLKDSVPFESVIDIMTNSTINIIPHVSNEHTDNTIPHKLFQILLSGKPLLVSDCAPLKRVVQGNDIGNCFVAGSAKSFADKVVDIESKYSLALEKSAKGYDMAFNGNLNWEHTSKELLKLYDTIQV